MTVAPAVDSPLADLLDVFDWKPTRLPTIVNQRFLAMVANDLNASAKQNGACFGREHDAARLVQAVRDLPDPALVRLVKAPETYHILSEERGEHSPELLSTLESWLHVERARLDPRYSLAAGAWSALGDCYLPAGPRSASGDGVAPGAWTPDAPYHAPLVHGTIPVDCLSPHAQRALPSASYRPIQIGPVSVLSPDEQRAVLYKLSAAMDGMSRLARTVHGFVLSMVRVILPRLDGVNPWFYTSASSRSFIGRVTLVNPQRDDITTAVLASSLVHEAIHAFLYMCELQTPFVHDFEEIHGTLLVSPWTGGKLPIHTYLHACFVWYGLARLWRLPGVDQVFPAEAAAEQRARATVGFEKGILEPLEPVRQHVSRYILDKLQQMDASHP